MHFTQELVEKLNSGQVVVSDVGNTIPGISSLEDKLSYLHEACSASVQGHLDPTKVAVAVRAAGLDADGDWTKHNIAYIIWLLTQETSGQAQLFDKLKDLVQELIKSALVTKSDLLHACSVEALTELGVVADKAKNKEGQVRGNVFYKIAKFNLLREENEGFSKMLVRLQSFGAEAAAHPENVDQILMEIRSLIGYFDLDPNRVAALVLDAFQFQWDNLAYLQLLPLFSPTAIYASLGFIMDGYQAAGELVPDNLYRMSIQLIKHKVFPIDELWRRLSPEDAALIKLQKEAQKRAFDGWRAKHGFGNNNKKDPIQAAPVVETADSIAHMGAVYGITAGALNLDPRQLATLALQPLWDNNQKLELLRVACEMGEVDLAWALFKGLKASGVEPADYPPVNRWMARRALAGISLSPPERLQHGTDIPVPLPSMSADAERILDLMGLSFSMTNELWIGVVRFWRQLLLHHQRQAQASPSLLGEVCEKVCQELIQRIFPGLALMSPDAFLANEAWALLQLLPYRQRYELYEDLAKSSPRRPDETSSVEAILQQAATDNIDKMVRRVAGRMAFEQNVKNDNAAKKAERQAQEKLQTRAFAKLSHANPFTAADCFVEYAAKNGSHVESLTDLFADLSDLTLDILISRIIKRVARATPANRFKPDGVLVKDPIANVSKFAASLARKLMRDDKHHSSSRVDLHPLLQLVSNAAQADRNEVFVILADLMDIVAGVHALENPGDSELTALAGGEVLKTLKIVRKELRLSSKIAKAGMDRLADALTSESYGKPLAVPLFILLAQNRNMLIKGVDKNGGETLPALQPFLEAQAAESRVRTVCDRYDQINKAMVQYAEFLRSALVKHKYKELVPSLSDLLDPDKYGLEPEVAFLLYRPILSRVPFPETPSQRNPPPEDGEIPDGEEAPMEVEQDTEWEGVKWSHLCQAVNDFLPADADKGLGKPFYLLFWRLTYADIAFAEPAYENQIRALKDRQLELAKENDLYTHNHVENLKYMANIDDRKLATRQNKAQIELAKEHVRLLEKEKGKAKERWQQGIEFLGVWKNDMLADVDHTKTITAFVSHCILPRCVLTPEDAMFCALFIRELTLENTPFFSYMLVLQQISGPCGCGLLFTLTEREADNFGIFIREVLGTAKEWMLELDEKSLALLSKQGFRADGKTFAGPSDGSKALTKDIAIANLSGSSSRFLISILQILKANAVKTDNWRVATNALLVLDKIRTVCPLFFQHARVVTPQMKKIYSRLEPPKDKNGNFTEQPQALYNLAIKCWSDLEQVINANSKYDKAIAEGRTDVKVPDIRLYDQRKYISKQAAAPATTAAAGAKPASAAQNGTARAQAKPSTGQPSTGQPSRPPREATPKAEPAELKGPSRDKEVAVRGEKDGSAREAAAAAREVKDEKTSHRNATKEAASAREAVGARDSARPPRDPGVNRNGKEHGTRGGRDHAERADRAATAKDGRHSSAATAKAGETASRRGEDKLAATRAAALLERKQSSNGDAVAKAASERRPSPKAEKARHDADGAAAKDTAVNGTVAGSKRRATDAPKPSDTRDSSSRGPKAAKTDGSAASPAVALDSKLNGASATPAATRKSTRSNAAADEAPKSELRASAPAFQPSDAHTPAPRRSSRDTHSTRDAEPTPKPPPRLKVADRVVEGSKMAVRDTAATAAALNASNKRASLKQEATAGADAATAGSRRAGQDEQPLRTASKRPREEAPATGQADSKQARQIKAEDESKTAGAAEPQSEPKRRKRIPIEFKVPPSTVADTSVEDRLAQRGGTQREAAKSTQAAGTDAKHAQHEARDDNEQDRSRIRESFTEASDAKLADRGGRAGRSEPAAKHSQHESKYELDRAKRDAERAKEERTSREDTRQKDSDRGKRQSTDSRRHSLTRSENHKAAAQLEETEDGEVQHAEPAAQPLPEAPSSRVQDDAQNAADASDAGPSPSKLPAVNFKGDSDGKDSKKHHKSKRKKEHKEKKDKKEHKEKKDKKKHKRDKEKDKEGGPEQGLQEAGQPASSPAGAAPSEAAAAEPSKEAQASPSTRATAAAPDSSAKSKPADSPRQAQQHTAPANKASAQQGSAPAQELRSAAARTGSGPSTSAAGGGKAAATAGEGLDANDLRHRLNSRRTADQKTDQPHPRASLVSQVGQVSRSQPVSHSQAPRVVTSELDFRPVHDIRSELDFRPVNDHRAEPSSRGSDRGGRVVQIEEPPRRLKRQTSRRG